MFLCFLNKALFVAIKFLSVSLCVGALPWSMTDLPTLCAASPAFVRAGLGEMAELAALETGAGLNTGFVGAGFYEMAQLATLETGVLLHIVFSGQNQLKWPKWPQLKQTSFSLSLLSGQNLKGAPFSFSGQNLVKWPVLLQMKQPPVLPTLNNIKI